MNRKQIIPSSDDLFRAEKQVFAGIFGRLYARYILRYEPEYASFLALAVARVLLSMSWEKEKARVFMEQNQDRIRQEILALKDEIEIRRMVTDTLIMRVVALHKAGGCGADSAGEHIDRIRTLGIYLEGNQPPTPGSFVRTASRFFSLSPISPAIPRWKG